MSARTASLTLLLAFTSLLASDRRPLAADTGAGATHAPARIRFLITTVEERGGERNVISEATVEGPAGTDFQINLQGERFKLGARFLTDLLRPGALQLRARLSTRRFYGYSPHNLPLYEEDSQRETLELGFDEAVVLLPFGRGGDDDRLKIEITPSMSEQTPRLPSGKARPLEIKFLKELTGGRINIGASKVPHRFIAEVLLLENGQTVARATAPCLLEEAREIALQPTAQAPADTPARPLVVRLSVDEYTRSRPADDITLSFDVYRLTAADGAARDPVVANGAGIVKLGANLDYDLSDRYAPGTGSKYELRFSVRLADDEQAD